MSGMKGVCAYMLFVTFLVGLNSLVAGQPTLLHEDFNNGITWQYGSNNNPGFVLETDSLGRVYVSDWGSPNDPKYNFIETALCRPIQPSEHISISFKPICLSDISGQMVGVAIYCLNDADEEVFTMAWFEPQAGIGMGGVTFIAEGNWIYGDTSGFDSEYPTINGMMEMRRTGEKWVALVDGIVKDSLILPPSKPITKIMLGFYEFGGSWPERDVCVDFVSLKSRAGGDANGDGNGNVGDAVYLINWIFKGGPPPTDPANDDCP